MKDKIILGLASAALASIGVAAAKDALDSSDTSSKPQAFTRGASAGVVLTVGFVGLIKTFAK